MNNSQNKQHIPQEHTPLDTQQLVASILKGNYHLYIAAFIAIIVSAMASYATPLIIRFSIDNIISGQPADLPAWVLSIVDSVGGMSHLAQNLWIMSICVVVLAVINSIGAYVRGLSSATASERMCEDLRNRAYDHIQHLEYNYHVNAETGDLLQRCSSDINTCRRFFGSRAVELVKILISCTAGLIIMFSISVKLAWLSVIMIPLVFVFSVIFHRRMHPVFQEIEAADAKLSTTIQESLSGVRVVRAFGQQKQELDKFDTYNAEFRDSIIKINKLMGNFWGGSDIIIYAQLSLVVSMSAYMVLKGEIGIGTMIAFTSFVGMLLWPLRELGRIVADLNKTSVAMGRILGLLNTVPEKTDGIVPDKPLVGQIEFSDVSFSYNADKAILKNVSFSIKPGQTVAVLGPTGSGKSTLMYLLQRLYDPTSGTIKVDGKDITEYNRKWLRKNIGLILQEPFLYSRSIKENIAITCRDVEESRLNEAIRISALADTLEEFESGYETIVGERGITLSGGQKQRVAIARTIVQETPVIIFDDSLSALDTETDLMIRNELTKRKNTATTVIISHRITTLSQADLILVLEDGQITQRGSHEELCNQEGLYKRVWEIQNAQ